MSYDPFQNSAVGRLVDNVQKTGSNANEQVAGAPLSVSPFAQMIVLEVFCDPTIIDDAMADYLMSLGVANHDLVSSLPRNTILAKTIADGMPGSSRPPMFVYPFFAHMSPPVKPGEHVWVLMYPDLEKKAGSIAYWMTRVVEPHCVDDVNHTHSPRIWDTNLTKGTKDEWDNTTELKYGYPNGRMVTDEDGAPTLDPVTAPLIDSPYSNNIADAYVDLQKNTNAGKLSTVEPVPRFRKRPGDYVLEGSNNTLIVLGTDRTGPAAEYTPDPDAEVQVAAPPANDLVGNAGAIDIVAGRGQTPKTLGKTALNDDLNVKEIAKSLKNNDPDMQYEGDPDFQSDRTRIYVAQRTMPDTKLHLVVHNADISNLEEPDAGCGAAIIKSDKVRIIARSDIEFLVSGFETDADGNMIELTDPTKMASVIIKNNGDIIFKPATQGYIKLGDDTADRALLCTDLPATFANGAVSPATAPLSNTMGGMFGGTQIASQGTWAKKILVTGAK